MPYFRQKHDDANEEFKMIHFWHVFVYRDQIKTYNELSVVKYMCSIANNANTFDTFNLLKTVLCI